MDLFTRAENYINSHIARVTPGFVKSSAISFVYSFSVSALFAKHNQFNTGLYGGVLSVAASVIDVVFKDLIRKISSNHIDEDKRSELARDSAKFSFVAVLLVGHNLHINGSASYAVMLPVYLWNLGKHTTAPLFGFVAH